MKKTIIILFIILTSANSYAFDKWTKTDTIFQLTYSVIHIVDWGQTLNTAKNYDKFYEKNKILGTHPSTNNVHKYFLITLVGHAAISYVLPHPYRRYWQFIWIGFQLGNVAANYNAGVNINF